ncbi:5'-nucleotidase, lipoprotein e(P4) family [Porphyromonas sp. COT-290 OH860]|uniref:5'-nucleotidase, lipoprotein e(P4) family n=1 Tax=Porphyromonas sp. COT-290 OH860 TaxID=1515615 RepID=UPI00052D092E|nr:5'-nucleotidase, lipoprotein e(P4) family [Porphyromonas sp. COT-290 OH860]KGN84304.1 5'-nucleotidase [Porphyromonas sp. COT-290 OH860]
MMKLISTTLLILAVASGLTSCVIGNKSYPTPIETTANRQANKTLMSPTLGGKLYTSAWIQRSAEYKALCLQAYNIASLRLDAATAKPLQSGQKPWAIVTDIDETILDNTPNAVHQALKGEDYTDASWDEWCDRAEADTLAGARDFFLRADKAGVKIFYISNRNEKNKAGTLRNLKAFGFPQVVDSQLILRSTTSDKTARRNYVLEQYNILMLIGDNLGDFDHIFDSSNELERKAGLNRFVKEFGNRFIVLPNPNYGTWEKAMNQGYPPLFEKDKKLKSTLLRNY